MFRHDRGALERLEARLAADRVRVARSRERLGRAGPDVFRNKLALLAPLTAGALVGAAAQHREPRGGRFSAAGLLASTTALTGLVETFRSEWMPLLKRVIGPTGAHGARGPADDRAGGTAPAGTRPDA